MTKTSEGEHSQESPPEEQETELFEPEPQHPGWLPLDKILKMSNPLFEKCLFMLGYDVSSNIYVIQGDYLTIVDPGNDYTALMELFKLGFDFSNIKKIVVTHGHHDHVMGAFELISSYPSILESGGYELILHEASPSELKTMAREMKQRVTEVRGGETLDLSGFEWEVIHTPGHTIDGISLYNASTRTAITGDTVMPHAMAEPDTRSGGGSMDHYLFGVKELLQRDIENILPGHGAPIASIGRRVIEQTYESLMMKFLGVESPIPWIEGAMSLAQKGLLEEAVFCCDKQLLATPEDLRSLQLKSLCLIDIGQFHKALETLDELETVSSQQMGDPFILIGKGRALMGLEKYQESIPFFDEALKIRPDFQDALVHKGMALYLAGNFDEAMEIEAFRNEFIGRFKDEMLKKKQGSN